MGLTTRYWRPLAVVLAVVAVVSAAGLSGCGMGARHGRAKDAGSTAAPIVAATVNGKPIYISDVEAEATVRGMIREGEDFDPTSDQFYQILEDLIETRLFAMEAEKRQLDRNADVRHRLDRARELILAGALNDEIRDTALDEAAVERMYRDQVRLLRNGGPQVHLRDAVFATKEAAQAAKRRLDSGAATFEEVAYDASIDRVTGAEGGDMGFVDPNTLNDGVRQTAQSTPVGQVSAPFQATGGWHLIKIEERKEGAPPSIESLRPKIEQWLMFEEQRRLVEKLKSQARIERIIEDKDSGVSASRAMPAPESAGGGLRPDPRKRDGSQLPMGPGGIAGAAGQGVAPAVEAPAAAPGAGQSKAASGTPAGTLPGTPPAAPKRRANPMLPTTPTPAPDSPLIPPPSGSEPKPGEHET